jgi:pyridoxal phosphate enzyme (YggS family)
MNEIAGNLAKVLQALEKARSGAGRPPGSVRLVAVSKTFPAGVIRAAAAAGQRAFGENYLQEALGKIAELGGEALEWHFIGPVQSNKTRELAARFAWVHGIDRLKVAQRLCAQRPAGMPALEVCIQVNIAGEPGKSGCTPAEAPELCAAVALLPRLRLRGLMTIPAAAADPEAARPAFRDLRLLHERIRATGTVDPAAFDTLSMGMSADYAVAVQEGATLVRVGSAIFGRREAAGAGRNSGEGP